MNGIDIDRISECFENIAKNEENRQAFFEAGVKNMLNEVKMMRISFDFARKVRKGFIFKNFASWRTWREKDLKIKLSLPFCVSQKVSR